MQISPRTELPLMATSATVRGCCTTTKAQTTASTFAGVEYGLEGLTCGGCVAKVERAVTDLNGVESAAIELVPGGVSRLLVTGTAGSGTIGSAVRAAGYSITNR
ncbi:heavy-metal-associated domain-containing protein [Paenarthrobacter nicotinovorans]|uniref:heavy-metal-associated domain-containing protein n=1 Tax=Paenarthrobacter nicotinovorans TaxID=29320 RepID=UPI0037F3F5F0